MSEAVPAVRMVTRPSPTQKSSEDLLLFIAGGEVTAKALVHSLRAVKGGEGSGFHDHAGRPGKRGGSAKEKVAATPIVATKNKKRADIWKEIGSEGNHHDDPLLFDLVAAKPNSPSSADFEYIGERSKLLKDRVATVLAERANLTYEEANEFVKQWSISSHDSSVASLTTQAVAGEMFGITLGPFAQVALDAALTERQAALQSAVQSAKLDNPDAASGDQISKILHEFIQQPNRLHLSEKDALEKLRQSIYRGEVPTPSIADLPALLEQTATEGREKAERAVKAMYEYTQERLADLGVTQVVAYRGMVSDEPFTKGDRPTVSASPLTSWSLDYSVAEMFAFGELERQGVVFSAVIPAERVFAVPSTGIGCLDEFEVVAVGGEHGALIQKVISAQQKKKEYYNTKSLDALKGGEGSGHFGHAGRPGKRGGSASVALFHGTTTAYRAAIKEQGLIAAKGKGADAWAKARGWTVQRVQVAGQAVSVFVTADLAMARQYADYAVEMGGGEPVVLKITLPADAADRLLADENQAGGLRFEGTIPPDWITFDDDAAKSSTVYAVALVSDIDTSKGGEGSGFHGHAGRPGKRGGSAPSSMELGDVSDRLDVTRDSLLYGTRSVLVDGVRVHIGVGVSYPRRERDGSGMVDTDGKIIAGPKDWLMQDAMAVPEVVKAVEDSYAALADQRGGDFAKAEPTDYQDRIAALLHGYKSPLTYERNLDTLNAMTRAYLANGTAEIVRSEDRVAKIKENQDRLMGMSEKGELPDYLQPFLDGSHAELFKAKVTALAFADRAMELGDQEAVNQFASEVQRTQADLRTRYGDTVTLYRGVNGDYAKAIKKGTKKAGSSVGVAIYPASSWTNDQSIAREFATKSGVVIKQTVPVERVLFSYHTSPYIRLSDWAFGGKQEYEFIIASPTDTLTLTKEDLL